MRRVLILTYYWPPSGGPGVQRVLKFARYLNEFGWMPTVVTVRNGAYPDLDPTLVSEVPDSVRVRRTGSWDPYALYARWLGVDRKDAVSVAFLNGRGRRVRKRIARWVRANLFIPDARVGWVPFGTRALRKMRGELNADAVFSTGPPHSTHLIGRQLSRDMDLPWIADFRDPWTDVTYNSQFPMSRIAQKMDAGLEQSVLDDADIVTTVSSSWCELLSAKSASDVELIRNGYDPSDLEGIKASHSDVFAITHVGNFAPARNPATLWRVLGELRREGRIPKLQIRMVGNVDHSIVASLREHDLRPFLKRWPYVPHQNAIEHMMSASVLLLTLNRSDGPEFSGHVPAKLYEYIAAGRPVLAIGGTNTDAARLLQRTGRGRMVDYGDSAAIRDLVMRTYERWQCGREQEFSGDFKDLTRQYQTRQLAHLLDSL